MKSPKKMIESAKDKVEEMVESAKDAAKEAVEQVIGNRTGVTLSPGETAEMLDASRRTPVSPGDESALAAVRASFLLEAEPLGTVPPPVTPSGMLAAAGKTVTGEHMAVLVDKLGERLAFERGGVRLYDALLAKIVGTENLPGGITRERAEQFRREEAHHAELVREALVSLGGDPTVITPSADVQDLLAIGARKVLQDPRTDIGQCLEGILLAELADNDSWAMLIQLTRELGQEELALRFETALAEEQEHLSTVREWASRGMLERAGKVQALAEE